MVGLSVVLEEQKWDNDAHRSSNILNKATILKISMGMIVKSNNVPVLPTPGANILDFCSLCKKKLLPGKDIYMYKGDGAFCTVECRSKQIMMDEEETRLARMRDRKSRCSFAAIKNTRISATSSSSSSSKPRHHHLYHHHQGPGAQDRSFTYRYYPTITPYMRKY